MKKELFTLHKKQFKKEPIATYFIPGCVPVLGENIEEAGSDAIMIAIDKGQYATVSRRNDAHISIVDDAIFNQAENFIFSKPLKRPLDSSPRSYIEALFERLHKEKGDIKKGLNIVIHSTLPGKFGFSRTPGRLLLLTMILNAFCNWKLTETKSLRYINTVFVDVFQEVTHMNELLCMYFNKPNSFMFINSKKHESIALENRFENYTFYVLNPDFQQDKEFKVCKNRIRSIKAATEYFQTLRPIDNLCELDMDVFNRYKSNLGDRNIIQHTEHVFSEYDRLQNAKEAIQDNDMDWFYEYLKESQQSLKVLFEISTEDINFLVDTALSNGALAARLVNKACHKMVLILSENTLDDSLFEAFKDRYKKLYNNELSTLLVTFNKTPHNLTDVEF